MASAGRSCEVVGSSTLIFSGLPVCRGDNSFTHTILFLAPYSNSGTQFEQQDLKQWIRQQKLQCSMKKRSISWNPTIQFGSSKWFQTRMRQLLCNVRDGRFLIKLKYHAPFDPISVFQYKLCLNKFPKGDRGNSAAVICLCCLCFLSCLCCLCCLRCCIDGTSSSADSAVTWRTRHNQYVDALRLEKCSYNRAPGPSSGYCSALLRGYRKRGSFQSDQRMGDAIFWTLWKLKATIF